MKEVVFKNGHVLKVMPAPFADAQELLEALSAEAAKIPVVSQGEVGELCKNLICSVISSRAVKSALKKCLIRSTYDGGQGDLKIEDDTWTTFEARENYIDSCTEVIEENVRPFMKSLYALFGRLIGEVQKSQA